MIDRIAAIAAKRPVGVAAAVLVVLVPTLFSVFPKWGEWPLEARVPIVCAWLLVAAIAGFSAVLQSERVEQMATEPLNRRARLREAAAARLIRALLHPASSGFPAHYELRLFLLDQGSDRMVPAFESAGIAASGGWLRGQGATGLAWSANSRVLMRGHVVSDPAYGLTAEQQQRYASLAVVAAMPVRTARDRVIGVLTISSTTDDGFLDKPAAVLAHLELAQIIGRLLIDMLGGGAE